MFEIISVKPEFINLLQWDWKTIVLGVVLVMALVINVMIRLMTLNYVIFKAPSGRPLNKHMILEQVKDKAFLLSISGLGQ